MRNKGAQKRRPLRRWAETIDLMSLDAAALIGTVGRGVWRLYTAVAGLLLIVVLVVLGISRWSQTITNVVGGLW